MEWILGLLVLALAVTAIIVIYLSERINVFETLLGLNPKVTTEKLADHVTFGPNPFGDLNGETLWKAMAGESIDDPDVDVSEVDTHRPRYELVLTRHIEALIEDGRFDGRQGERSAPKSTLRIPMLRGSVESFIPYVEAARLYEIGQEIETTPEKQDALVTEVDEIVDDLFGQVQLERSRSFGASLMPQVSDSEEIPSEDDDIPDYTDEFPDASEFQDIQALPPSDDETSEVTSKS
jgi:hypothetical protein